MIGGQEKVTGFLGIGDQVILRDVLSQAHTLDKKNSFRKVWDIDDLKV